MVDLDASLPCSIWTRSAEVDPIGSAGTYDTVLLVECPVPWPTDVADIPRLADAVARTDASTRILAVVPRDPSATRVRVVRWRRSGARFVGTDHLVEPDGVPGLLAELLDDPDGDHPAAVGDAPADVLVCTHGRRDRCCGSFGTRVAVEVAGRWPGVRTWRCSHTGGHRFAPTGITFPDGRGWAFLDAAALGSIVERTGSVGDIAERYRGRLALDPWAQAAERELLVRHGWAWDPDDLRADVDDHGDRAEVVLAWTQGAVSGEARAEVRLARQVPVVPCGGPPTAATKSSDELAVVAFSESSG